MTKWCRISTSDGGLSWLLQYWTAGQSQFFAYANLQDAIDWAGQMGLTMTELPDAAGGPNYWYGQD